ncbi:MAG: hypothetical protein KBT27_06600 [Prevotellaceae bacterium]|nr:hypothetical protein [Candidatus Faecinaster equi]
MTSNNNVYRGNYLGPPRRTVEHHGIKGQKWGIRRFQNPDGSLTPAGKERYLASGGKLTEAGNKAFYDKHGNLNAAGKAYEKYKQSKQPAKELTPEEREARKQEAINSGDIEKVSALRHEMSQAEIKAALDRIDMYARIDKVRASKQVDAGQASLDKAMRVLDTTMGHAATAMKAWDNYENLKAKMKERSDKEKLKPILKAIQNEDWTYINEHMKEIPTKYVKEASDRIRGIKSLKEDERSIAEALVREEVSRAKSERDIGWFMRHKDKTTATDISDLAKALAADEHLKRIEATRGMSDDDTVSEMARYSSARDYESLMKFMTSLPDEKVAKFSGAADKSAKIMKYFSGEGGGGKGRRDDEDEDGDD